MIQYKYVLQICIWNIILLYFCMSNSFSQQINLTHINTKEGLPGSNVRKLHQDPYGYIWFGIEAVGLCKYDGVEYQVFKYNPDDENSLSNNFIWDIKSHNKNLWIATESGLNLYLRNKNKFFKFQTYNSNITDNWTTSLYLDSFGNLWVGTNNGLNKLTNSYLEMIYTSVNSGQDPVQSVKFEHYFYNNSVTSKLGIIKINQIKEDLEHNLWICTNSGIFILDSLSNIIEHLHSNEDQKSGLINNKVFFAAPYSDSTILIGTDRGLCLYETTTKSFDYNVFPQIQELNFEFKGYYCYLKDSGETIWIGMSEGLMIINSKLPGKDNFHFISKDKVGISSKIIKDILEDNTNQIWISTKFGGLHLFKKHRDLFHTSKVKCPENKTNKNIFVLSLFADSKDNIWIGTKFEGLLKYDIKSDSYESFKLEVNAKNPKKSNRIESINEDSNGDIYTCTPKGLNKLNTKIGKTTHYPFHQINCILDDSEGHFWVGSYEGLYLFDRKNQNFVSFTKSRHSHFFNNKELSINSILKDRNSNLWFGTYKNGIYWYNVKNDSLRHFIRISDDNHQISGNMIRSLYEDEEGNIWIGTKHNGLNCYSYETNKLKIFNVTDGLPSNTIYSILSDNNDDLWIGTHNGLSVYHKSSREFQNFDESHGLQSNIFENDAKAKMKNGLLLFGGCRGFNLFQPNEIKIEPNKCQLVVKSLKINNEDFLIDIDKDTSIQLKHFQNYIELKFALLSFINPSKTNYRYKMDGVDKDWIEAGTRNFVSYSNLKYGEYTFFLEAFDSDNSSVSNPIQLKINIIPPYWRTNMAITLYFLAFVFVLYQIHRLVNMRTNYINRLNETRKTIQRTIEVNEAKLRFFTNVSHEIKTPLSLISAPVEKLSNSSSISEVDKKNVLLIQKNTKRLLRLIEELLYFRKTQDEVIQLNAMRGNIVKFIEEISQPYAAFAEQNNIKFTLHYHEPDIELWFDPDKIEKIISNLLMNAFKFTQHHGSVEIKIENESINVKNRKKYNKTNAEPQMVKISVKDTGKGISKHELKNIFQYYYINNHDHNYKGTGIGLELTKTLVELHGGTISVESLEGKGSTFSFSLYKDNKHLKRNQISENIIITENYISEIDFSELLYEGNKSSVIEEQISKNSNKPLILVVEDDNDLRHFMSDNLSGRYNVLQAKDGKEGISLALQNIPDMIISDVMMPNLDGIQLCKHLKSEQITSHIPIILLTRKNDIEDQIKGLKTGADDYLSKPFNMQFLILRVHNIFSTIKKFKIQILKELGEGRIESENISIYDKTLLNKCLKAVSENISDSEFSVSELCKIVGMSRSQLYRKLNALTDQSPAEFIYSNRLIEAKKLLLNKDYSVTEVAHLTGFKSSNSFSTVFKKNFGMSPKDYTEKSILNCK